MNMQAWLDRHPTAGVLTPEVVTDERKRLVGDEYRTQLEVWESEITAVIWHMIQRRQKLEQIRRFLLTLGHEAIEAVSVTETTPMLGYTRAVSVSFRYRGHYRRVQVFNPA